MEILTIVEGRPPMEELDVRLQEGQYYSKSLLLATKEHRDRLERFLKFWAQEQPTYNNGLMIKLSDGNFGPVQLERKTYSFPTEQEFMKDCKNFPALTDYLRNGVRRNATMNGPYSSFNIGSPYTCAERVRRMGLEEFKTYLGELNDQFWRDQVKCEDKVARRRLEYEYTNYVNTLNKFWIEQAHERYFANTEQVAALEGEACLGRPQTSSQTTEALIDGGGVRQLQVQFQNDTQAVDIEAQISEPSLGPLGMIDSVGLEVGHSGRTNHQISLPEHNTGMLLDDITVDVGGFEISPPEDPEQNTGSLGDGVDLLLRPIRSNRIRRLVCLSACNIFFNATVGVYNLPRDLQGVHETFWRAQLIASVGTPITVAVFTLLASIRFASDPEGWSNWITVLSRVNAAMIGGGPLAFYGMRNLGTEK